MGFCTPRAFALWKAAGCRFVPLGYEEQFLVVDCHKKNQATASSVREMLHRFRVLDSECFHHM